MGIFIFDPTSQNFWACQNISLMENKRKQKILKKSLRSVTLAAPSALKLL